MNRIEVRFAGFGGQGVVLMGVVLGRAASLHDGLFAVQTQSYGAEARGGAARSDVIISSEPIDSPVVTAPDFLVALSQEALHKNIGSLKKEGLLMVEEDLVLRLPKDRQVYRIPAFLEASERLGMSIVANMVMLGFLVGLRSLVSVSALEAAVAETVPRGTEDLNLRAVRRGIELARELKEVTT